VEIGKSFINNLFNSFRISLAKISSRASVPLVSSSGESVEKIECPLERRQPINKNPPCPPCENLFIRVNQLRSVVEAPRRASSSSDFTAAVFVFLSRPAVARIVASDSAGRLSVANPTALLRRSGPKYS
jgi:hypothetical protein